MTTINIHKDKLLPAAFAYMQDTLKYNLSRNKREGKYAGKFKMSHGYGRTKHWRTEHFSVSLKAYGKRQKKLREE